MQTRYNPRCLNGNTSPTACITPDCLNNAFLCSSPECRCHSQHIKCQRAVFDKLIEEVMRRKRDGGKCVGKVVEFCDCGIKQLQVLRNYVVEVGEEGGVFGGEMERELLEGLGEGKERGFSGDFMWKLGKELLGGERGREDMKGVEEKIGREMRAQTQVLTKLVDKTLELINSPSHSLLNPQTIPSSFSTSLTSPSTLSPPLPLPSLPSFSFSASLSGSRILLSSPHLISYKKPSRLSLSPPSSTFHYSLLTPSLDSFPHPTPRIRLLIHQKYSLRLGISSFQYLSSTSFHTQFNDQKQGTVISYEGIVCSQDKRQHNLKLGEFEFDNGDVVEMEYDKRRKELRVRREGKGGKEERVVMWVGEEKGEGLHFSVGMRNWGEEMYPKIQCLM